MKRSLWTPVIFLAGLLLTVVSVTLIVNPGTLAFLPAIPYAASLIPLLLLSIVAFISPLLVIGIALLVMFGEDSIAPLARLISPISPFWTAIGLAAAGQLARETLGRTVATLKPVIVLAFLAVIAMLWDSQIWGSATAGIGASLAVGAAIIIVLRAIQTRSSVHFVVVVLFVAFVVLELELSGILITSWSIHSSTLRHPLAALDSALRQADSVSWLFNTMAALAIGIAVRQKGKTRILLLTFYGLFAASSILTFGRGAYLGLGAGIVALIWMQRKMLRKSMWLLFLASIVTAFLIYSSGSWASNYKLRGLQQEVSAAQQGAPGRLTLLIAGIQLMPEHWLVGSQPRDWGAHSLVIDTWLHYGGLYAIIFWAFILSLFFRSYKMAKASLTKAYNGLFSGILLGLYAAFAVALANSLFDPTLAALPFAVVFWVMRGLEIAITRSDLIQTAENHSHVANHAL